jgi:hypothetical protein
MSWLPIVFTESLRDGQWKLLHLHDGAVDEGCLMMKIPRLVSLEASAMEQAMLLLSSPVTHEPLRPRRLI